MQNHRIGYGGFAFVRYRIRLSTAPRSILFLFDDVVGKREADFRMIPPSESSIT